MRQKSDDAKFSHDLRFNWVSTVTKKKYKKSKRRCWFFSTLIGHNFFGDEIEAADYTIFDDETDDDNDQVDDVNGKNHHFDTVDFFDSENGKSKSVDNEQDPFQIVPMKHHF